MACHRDVTSIQKATEIRNEIPLRLTPCASASLFAPQKFDFAQDDMLTDNAALCFEKRNKKAPIFTELGAGDVTRTHDLLITNQLHYRLCYTSVWILTTYLLYPIIATLSISFFKKRGTFFLFRASLLILARMCGRMIREIESYEKGEV